MRTLIIFITVALLAVMVTSSLVDRQERSPLIHRPHTHRGRRSLESSPVIRQQTSPRGYHQHERRSAHANGGRPGISELQVTKGEYVCGDKICKLTPGVVPENCPHGMCQYPI